MQTLQGMLAQTIHEDRVREYSSPARRHAAEARAARTTGTPSIIRGLFARLGGAQARRGGTVREATSAEAGA
jgi:hypothetical protein